MNSPGPPLLLDFTTSALGQRWQAGVMDLGEYKGLALLNLINPLRRCFWIIPCVNIPGGGAADNGEVEEDWDRDWLSDLGNTAVIAQTASHKQAKVGSVLRCDVQWKCQAAQCMRSCICTPAIWMQIGDLEQCPPNYNLFQSQARRSMHKHQSRISSRL